MILSKNNTMLYKKLRLNFNTYLFDKYKDNISKINKLNPNLANLHPFHFLIEIRYSSGFDNRVNFTAYSYFIL